MDEPSQHAQCVVEARCEERLGLPACLGHGGDMGSCLGHGDDMAQGAFMPRAWRWHIHTMCPDCTHYYGVL